jgi:hypothetical protein
LKLGFVAGRLLLPFVVMGVFSAVFPQWLASLKGAPEWFSASVSALVTCATAVVIAGGIFLTRDDRQVLRSRVLALSFKKADGEPLLSAQRCNTTTGYD